MGSDIYGLPNEVIFKDGVGLKNISERLELQYENMAGLTFKKFEFGELSAIVHLPFEEGETEVEESRVTKEVIS